MWQNSWDSSGASGVYLHSGEDLHSGEESPSKGHTPTILATIEKHFATICAQQAETLGRVGALEKKLDDVISSSSGAALHSPEGSIPRAAGVSILNASDLDSMGHRGSSSVGSARSSHDPTTGARISARAAEGAGAGASLASVAIQVARISPTRNRTMVPSPSGRNVNLDFVARLKKKQSSKETTSPAWPVSSTVSSGVGSSHGPVVDGNTPDLTDTAATRKVKPVEDVQLASASAAASAPPISVDPDASSESLTPEAMELSSAPQQSSPACVPVRLSPNKPTHAVRTKSRTNQPTPLGPNPEQTNPLR